MPVLGLLYASTCGGPYGTEDFVARTGPGLFILLLFVTPWLFGVPLALTTAELSTRRSMAGGYYRWVRHYLGEFWGFQAGFWSLFSTLLDNALYPLLFANAFAHLLPSMSGLERWLVAVAFIAALTYLNCRGIRVAGGTALALNVFLVLPLIWMVVASIPRLRFNPLVPFTAPGIDLGSEFGTGLALAMWLYSGYSEVSTVAEEVERPSRNIPLALLIVTPLVILSYALPTLAGLAASGGWESWTSGQFTSIAWDVGGPLLGQWTFLGNITSQVVVFLAYMLWNSRIAWAMAADGYLPSFLTRLHPRYGTPHRVLVLFAVGYSLVAALPFEDLLVADMWLAGSYTVLTQFCLVSSRRHDAVDPDGFRVPGGRVGLWLNTLVPAATWILLLAFTAREHFAMGAGALLAGPLLYLLVRLLRRTRPAAGASRA